MTESQYTLATDLTKIRCAQGVLRQIVPSINDQIPDQEYRQVMGLLADWAERVNGAFKLEEGT